MRSVWKAVLGDALGGDFPGMAGETPHRVKTAGEGQTARFEMGRPGLDGKHRHVRVSIKPAVDERGQVQFLIAEGHDVTATEAGRRGAGAEREGAGGGRRSWLPPGGWPRGSPTKSTTPWQGSPTPSSSSAMRSPRTVRSIRYVERAEKEIQRFTRIIRLMYDLHRPNQEREAQVRIDETGS